MTRVLIDTNVIFPTMMRQIVLGLAREGYFTPLWSPRILEEFALAARRRADEALARAEIATMKARFPQAMVDVSDATEARLTLPDPADAHVLAAAIDGKADELLTMNLRDFPTRLLSAEGVVRRDPDGFLCEAHDAEPETVARIVAEVVAEAQRLAPERIEMRALLKRARLPRLAKRLT